MMEQSPQVQNLITDKNDGIKTIVTSEVVSEFGPSELKVIESSSNAESSAAKVPPFN